MAPARLPRTGPCVTPYPSRGGWGGCDDAPRLIPQLHVRLCSGSLLGFHVVQLCNRTVRLSDDDVSENQVPLLPERSTPLHEAGT